MDSICTLVLVKQSKASKLSTLEGQLRRLSFFSPFFLFSFGRPPAAAEIDEL
jgi:hypothetical protein